MCLIRRVCRASRALAAVTDFCRLQVEAMERGQSGAGGQKSGSKITVRSFLSCKPASETQDCSNTRLAGFPAHFIPFPRSSRGSPPSTMTTTTGSLLSAPHSPVTYRSFRYERPSLVQRFACTASFGPSPPPYPAPPAQTRLPFASTLAAPQLSFTRPLLSLPLGTVATVPCRNGSSCRFLVFVPA